MLEFIIIIVIIAFFFEILDSGAGMGFGTGLTPLLLLLDYTPLQVVPAILISESITGLVDSYFDNEFKNVEYSFRPLSDSLKLALLIAFFGCIAIFISIYLTYLALELPTVFIKIYVAVLVLGMGIFALFRTSLKNTDQSKPKPKLLVAFAAIAGFNKGVGGGGYGPVITLGQLNSGVYEKSATAIVSLSEAIVSIMGVITFIFISAAGVELDLVLLPSLFTGAFIGALITPYIVRVVPNKVWKIVIPVYAIGIGIYSFIKILGLM
ncbi:MAG: sulfite exporter TauE/SafE family protein [Promethearchaeota archaeon]|nr:MAG: sulfite exporter TauE/SafE family protein [Candidatus Lokiarchaeota archaeon]